MGGSTKIFITALICIAAFTSSGAQVEVLLEQVSAMPANIAVNVGDTVVWRAGGQSNVQMVRSFSGEFVSPLLIDPGSAFSFVFAQPGNFPYCHQLFAGSSDKFRPVGSCLATHGVVKVLPWTNTVPPITINTPLEGFHFAWRAGQSEAISILASVTNAVSQLDRVEFYVAGNFIGSIGNAPYRIDYTNAPLGNSTIVARSIDRQGNIRESPPVRITLVETSVPISMAPRAMIPGIFSFEYIIPPGPILNGSRYLLHCAPELPNFGTEVKNVRNSGIFIAPMNESQVQFYWVRARS